VAGRRNVTIDVSGDTGIAVVDPALIDRLLWNLLENAVKFTPAGGRVEVQLARQAAEVIIDVADTGPGIPENHLQRIFERFFRGDEARTAAADSAGTGLGLSIVSAIAGVHGGHVEVSNRVAGGALFRVRLPGVRAGEALGELARA
jgi:signal transduction histidine kinase